MKSIYEKLFDGYAEPILHDVDCFFDEREVFARLDALSLDQDARRRVEDLLFDCRQDWSAGAFALGLHLGLSLFHDNVRRGGSQ